MIESKVDGELRRTFRPEFLNRIDEMIFFNPLGRDQLDRIVRIQVNRYQKLLTDRQLELELTDEAAHLIAERGYDPSYGARPLKRSIQKNLIDPLANAILSGQFEAGDVIVASSDGESIHFARKPSAEEAA